MRRFLNTTPCVSLKITGTIYGENLVRAFDEFSFENWRIAVIETAKNLSTEGYPWARKGDAWINQVGKEKVAEYLVTYSLPFHSDMYFGLHSGSIGYFTIFRVILDAFPDNETIVLDYSDLVYGGYCEEIQDKNEFIQSKIIVLTEGKTDSEFISRSIKLLYPHLSKFYYFMDFEIMKVCGSVSYLVHYIKAFAGAGISSRIIGLFDNDVAALDSIMNLEKIQLPDNIKIQKLPEIEIAKNYPTLGPTENQNIDINGLACSIELFLGKDVLGRNDGSLTPIRWYGNHKIYKKKRERKKRTGIQLPENENPKE